MTALRVFLVLFVSAAGLQAAPQAGNADAPNVRCLRCHGMATMAVPDEATGGIRSLAVDPHAYSTSNHRNLACLDCHDRSADRIPHGEALHQERLHCLNCHKDDPKFEARGFPEVHREFSLSVHRQRLGDKFDCFACHDPHTFRLSRPSEGRGHEVRQDNAVCLSCHDHPERFRQLTPRRIPDLGGGHEWLPNREMHFAKVRCLDCHAQSPKGHLILPAPQSARNCTACHTTQSILGTRLAKYEAGKVGFLNAALLGDSYVIGATRNLWLDRLSLVLFTLTALGMGLHALGRWLAARRRRKGGRP